MAALSAVRSVGRSRNTQRSRPGLIHLVFSSGSVSRANAAQCEQVSEKHSVTTCFACALPRLRSARTASGSAATAGADIATSSSVLRRIAMITPKSSREATRPASLPLDCWQDLEERLVAHLAGVLLAVDHEARSRVDLPLGLVGLLLLQDPVAQVGVGNRLV